MTGIARIFAIAVAVALTVPAVAQRQPRALTAKSDKAFEHKNSGIGLPASLDGLPRDAGREFDAPELDVNFEYAAPDGSRFFSVYVYRATTGSAAVWFDRASFAIESLTRLGTPARNGIAAAFIPPGQQAAAGLIGSWSLSGGPMRSTALAIVPMGEWLVKFRYTTKLADAPTADAQLRQLLTQIDWPDRIAPEAAVAPVADCQTALAFEGEATVAKPDMTAALLGGVLAMAAGRAKADPKAARVVWCRDPVQPKLGGVYRANAATDGYLLAISDAGRGITIGPTEPLLDPKAAKSWAINLVLPGRTITYPSTDRLPRPEQVVQILSGPSLSSASTWGKQRDIAIQTP